MTEDSTGEEMEAAAPVTQAEETHIPVAALQEERAKRQRIQEELEMIKENVNLLSRQREQPKKEEEYNYSDDDVVTYGELKKKEQQMQATLKEVRMLQKYPDYADVVTKHLPEVLKKNPGLRASLETTQDYEMAYYLAKNSDSYKSQKATPRNEEAERIVKNSQQPGSLSSVGQTSPVSLANKYKNMSDEEFRAEVARNMGY